MSMRKILEVKNIKKYYGHKSNMTKAIDGVSFNVNEGELLAIMGPSGSGKSTLLNVISTIDTPDSGEILIDNIELTKVKNNNISEFRRKKLGFIFQELNLIDTLTLYENIQLALTINKCKNSQIDDKVKSIADKLGIGDILGKYPYEVSGGQKQRCACARAIINNPSIILADEPTGALDSASAKKLLNILKYINKEFNVTILIVTHDSYVASNCNRVLFIKDGELFKEVFREGKERAQMYKQILDLTSKFDEEPMEYDLY